MTFSEWKSIRCATKNIVDTAKDIIEFMKEKELTQSQAKAVLEGVQILLEDSKV